MGDERGGRHHFVVKFFEILQKMTANIVQTGGHGCPAFCLFYGCFIVLFMVL